MNTHRSPDKSVCIAAALGGGFATLLHPDIAKAASDLGNSVTTQGIWPSVFAGVSLGTLGLLGMAAQGKAEQDTVLEKLDKELLDLQVQVPQHPSNLDNWRVIGDHLLSQGDFRGELIHLRLEEERIRETAPSSDQSTKVGTRTLDIILQIHQDIQHRFGENAYLDFIYPIGFSLWYDEHRAGKADFLEKIVSSEYGTGLRELSIRRFTRQTLRRVTTSSKFEKITSLKLEGSSLGVRVARAIAKSSVLKRLVYLHLWRSGIGDTGAEVLAKSENLANLHLLDLRWNQIGNAGAQAIADSEFLDYLDHLDLSHNNIGDEGAAAIMKSAPQTYLSSLDLRSNEISDETIQAILESPVLEIFNGEEIQRSQKSVAESSSNLQAFAGPAIPILETLLHGQPSTLGMLLGGLAMAASTAMAAGVFSHLTDWLKSKFTKQDTTTSHKNPSRGQPPYRTAAAPVITHPDLDWTKMRRVYEHPLKERSVINFELEAPQNIDGVMYPPGSRATFFQENGVMILKNIRLPQNRGCQIRGIQVPQAYLVSFKDGKISFGPGPDQQFFFIHFFGDEKSAELVVGDPEGLQVDGLWFGKGSRLVYDDEGKLQSADLGEGSLMKGDLMLEPGFVLPKGTGIFFDPHSGHPMLAMISNLPPPPYDVEDTLVAVNRVIGLKVVLIDGVSYLAPTSRTFNDYLKSRGGSSFGGGTLLAALVAGLATLLAPEISHAATDVMAAISNTGTWIAPWAALAGLSLGILAIARKGDSKKELLARAKQEPVVLEYLIFEAESGDKEFQLGLQNLEVEAIKQRAVEGSLRAFRLLQKLSAYYDNQDARNAIRRMNLDYWIQGPKIAERTDLLIDAAFWGNESAQWTLILEQGSDPVIDKFFDLLPNAKDPASEQIRAKLTQLAQLQQASTKREKETTWDVTDLIKIMIQNTIREGIHGDPYAMVMLEDLLERASTAKAVREAGVEDLEMALPGNWNAWGILEVLTKAGNIKAAEALKRQREKKSS